MIEITAKTALNMTLFERIIERTQNLRSAMGLVGEIVHNSILENFRVGGRPKWKKLMLSTIMQRRRLGYWPGLILVRRGMAGGLMGSISYRPFSKKVVISANKVYAGRQNRARPFMVVQKNDMPEMGNAVLNFILGRR